MRVNSIICFFEVIFNILSMIYFLIFLQNLGVLFNNLNFIEGTNTAFKSSDLVQS